MRTEDKRYPALTDLDLMPFGKHKGTPMQDVPASYLEWLWNKRPLVDQKAVENYIWNSKEAIEKELGHEI
jgi:hypothetical protein